MADGMKRSVDRICIKESVVAGANADTNIAISGIKTTDQLISVVEYAAGVPTSRLATTEITSDGNIQCSVSTAGDTLVVLWHDRTESA